MKGEGPRPQSINWEETNLRPYPLERSPTYPGDKFSIMRLGRERNRRQSPPGGEHAPQELVALSHGAQLWATDLSAGRCVLGAG